LRQSGTCDGPGTTGRIRDPCRKRRRGAARHTSRCGGGRRRCASESACSGLPGGRALPARCARHRHPLPGKPQTMLAADATAVPPSGEILSFRLRARRSFRR
jgi:hypothetical protein